QTYVADTILIATGSTARPLRVPGADLPNVFALRTLDDADRLLNALDKAKQVGRATPRGRGQVAVIGGGVLGPELAGTLAEMGYGVDLVVGGAHPWWKFAGETIGRFARRVLNDVGVIVHEQVRVERIEGDGRAQRVVLAGGQTIACDLVISATGAIPNRDLLRGTPIDAEKAILTDAQTRTNIDRIFAAGDCAAIFDPLFGKHRIIDHWPHAIESGRIAGANMAAALGHGPMQSFSGPGGFGTSLPGPTPPAVPEPRRIDHRLVRGNGNAIAEIGIDTDGRVAFVCTVGRPDEHAALQQLVTDRRDIRGTEESLKDPETPLGQGGISLPES
ncbi:MAG TPA: NAD(P)/FAD-dependent oxidoreductase, partial [Tepidisphaeraceae bacterium]|nr:NAD(P)/FAD-dependent oxidoreductase [Tepidisphaeraceae bacterium]